MAGYFRLFKLTTIHIYSLHVVFLTRSVAARVSRQGFQHFFRFSSYIFCCFRNRGLTTFPSSLGLT
ncbi:hypothetical protein HanRHA438_Chr11g0530501 [Helianthus annuus]|nr:hypothetical protein HanRHA438_Chr11g0530501 [Helianthus annuus]